MWESYRRAMRSPEVAHSIIAQCHCPQPICEAAAGRMCNQMALDKEIPMDSKTFLNSGGWDIQRAWTGLERVHIYSFIPSVGRVMDPQRYSHPNPWNL